MIVGLHDPGDRTERSRLAGQGVGRLPSNLQKAINAYVSNNTDADLKQLEGLAAKLLSDRELFLHRQARRAESALMRRLEVAR
jgi:hypothetical protein